MGDPIKLSPPFNSVEEAVKAGFKAIMADNNKQETEEFGFWVVIRPDKDKKKPQFHFTEPVGGGSGEVSQILPVGEAVIANCHTHPKRISTGNFSTGDKRSFVELRKKRSGISWFLLNPQSEIRRAGFEKDFPAGISVPW